MSKMRVYELAKELGRDNREIMNFLTAHGVEVKSHMSVLEEDQIRLVRQKVPVREIVRRPARPAGEGGTEPPKKKNISRVFRSQNSRTGIQRPAGMRPARPAGARPAGVRPAAPGMHPEGVQGRPAGVRPEGSQSRPAGMRPEGIQGRPAGARPEGTQNRLAGIRPEGTQSRSAGVRSEGSQSRLAGVRTEGVQSRPAGIRQESTPSRTAGARPEGAQSRSAGESLRMTESHPVSENPGAAVQSAAEKTAAVPAHRESEKPITKAMVSPETEKAVERPAEHAETGKAAGVSETEKAAEKLTPQPTVTPVEKTEPAQAAQHTVETVSGQARHPETKAGSGEKTEKHKPEGGLERTGSRESRDSQGERKDSGSRDSRGQDGRKNDRERSQDGRRSDRDGRKSFGDRDGRSQGERRSFGDRDGRNQGERRSFGDRDGRSQGERRSFGDRDGRNQGERSQDGRRSFGDRDGRSQGGERRSFGDRDGRSQGGERRSFGDRDGRSQGGERRSFGDRDGRSQGERRSFGDRDGRNQGERRSFGDRDSRGQGARSQGRNGSRGLSIPQPDMDSKPVTKESRIRSDKDKEKYNNKHDRFDREEKGQGRPGQKNNSGRNEKKAGRFIKPVKPVTPQEKKEDEVRTIILPDRLTIRELAELLKVQAAAIVKKLFLQGTMVTVNHEVDYDTAEEIALEYNCIAEHEEKVDVIAELLKEEEENEEDMVPRPPVVCVMGHVDHGKTSLLDAIRHTHVIEKEAGGITQHIGAYTVSINGQKITFLDTPGHEAFTAMRMRGANATDIAVLVVAADDGVMPQTVEAISHAKAANTEIIVAINKIDKPGANIDRVKQELTEHELVPEDWGGSTVCVPVSAHTHEGLDTLLEMILLTAEVAELKANPKRRARGLVIEAKLDKGKGPVATVLVQKGTLHVGDVVAAGASHGKVRAMMDDKGRRVKEAGPSMPVEILGLSDVPNAGEVFVCCENEKDARSFAETFIGRNKEKLIEETKARMSLDDLFSQIQAGNLKELNLIVKADVQGSVEAVKQSLLKLSNDEVVVKVIHGGVGAINESDVSLASASNAIIIGFNTKPDPIAKATAERENVDIRLYRVIYDAIADVEGAMKGMLDPVYEEKVIGHAEIRQIFRASGVGNIAGSYVLDGVLQRNCSVRISREGKQIYEGSLASLKRFKDDVKEVKAGYECGLVFEKFNDIQELDQVEAYVMVEVPR